MTEQDTAVRLSGIELNRPHFKLGPADLAIPAGYVTAIVGPNGSGKSTLFRLLLDLAKPDRGERQVLGETIGQAEQTELKQRIGYLPEETNMGDNDMTGAFKTVFVRSWYPRWDVNRYRELLRLFEVDDGLKLGKMSKGMRRKYELALALAHQPELLLLDEPSSGLDPLAWRTMIDVLHRYMESGERTIVMASHIVEEVKRLADYIVFMAYGRVLGMYEKDELLGSWHTFFVAGDGLSAREAEAMPGQRGVEETGGSIRVVTERAYEAERWCAEEGVRIVHRQPMELDDILAALLERERVRARS